MIYNDMTELIGSTPLYKLNKIAKYKNLSANVYAKLEMFNPIGSIKDRAALSMIETAEKNGLLKEGGTVIEPTSGNTGIGLSAICAVKGYRAIFVMPDTMSVERRKLLTAFGGEVVLTDGSLGMQGAVQKAEELNAKIDGSIIAGQFVNPANPLAHYNTTAPEIYSDLQGKIDIFVAGVGTGGTVTGIAKFLKEKNKDIKVYAIEPKNSTVLSGGRANPHKIQGIGANFIPKVFDKSLIDGVISISDEEAYFGARLLAKKEGILAGISSGANLMGAISLASMIENTGKNIVTVFPDTGERYLSTDLF
ncbi:MAG: cysteine synthase A [Clostridiales bacterium]|nr:cysteine synthase A [Clostridiales bacterium]